MVVLECTTFPGAPFKTILFPIGRKPTRSPAFNCMIVLFDAVVEPEIVAITRLGGVAGVLMVPLIYTPTGTAGGL